MKRLTSACLVMLVAGCAATPRPAPVEERAPVSASGHSSAARAPTVKPAPAVAPTPPGVEVLPLGSAPAAPAVDAPAPAANPAVVALLNRANRNQAAGDLAAAAADIERALAIDPDSAWLWHRFARARLALGDLGQAASLAARSNALAGGDPRLQADNWRLIADVHRRRGEHVAAERAAQTAADLDAGAL